MIIMIMIIMLMMMMILVIVVTKGAKCPQNFCQKRRFCNLENIDHKTKLFSPKAQRRAAETQAATPVSSSVAVLNMLILIGLVLNVRNVHRFWLLTCFTNRSIVQCDISHFQHQNIILGSLLFGYSFILSCNWCLQGTNHSVYGYLISYYYGLF